ncbi:MAG: HNH endonuclease [Candidatus Omnitrophica bacterium]|nr:HNH endonuclease [Candidatus Omnitrophota bacterium]
MPDRDVKTIQDLLYYQYAKIIARRAFGMSDGKAAKGKHYGFIKETFRDLKKGEKSWSEITREDWQLVEAEKKCIYCGSTQNLHKEHIVPKSIRIKPECETCEHVQEIHNQIWACESCNSSKGTKGLYEFYQAKYPHEKKFFDFIPPLLEKKYLKTIYNCHQCTGTLEKADIDGDSEISVLDIDHILH